MTFSAILRRIAPLYPLLLAVAPILLLAAENIDQITPDVLWTPLIVAFSGAALLLAGLWLVRRDGSRAAAITALCIGLFFSYGHAFEYLFEGGIIRQERTLYALLSLASLIILGVAGTWLWRTRRGLDRLTQFAVVMSVVVFAIAVRETIHEYKHSDAIAVRNAKSPKTTAAARGLDEDDYPPRIEPLQQDRPDRPDIYYIILDGYARNDVLQDAYGFDNSDFTNYLQAKGFLVAKDSLANYPMTFLSLASSLNMRYVNDDAAKIGAKGRARTPIYNLIKDNYVGRYLQSKGYRYIHIASNFGATESSRVADDTRYAAHPLLQREFMAVLLKTTMLRPLVPNVATIHLFALEQLQEIARVDGPTFTFCHMVLPHNPYVFDREGNVRADVPLSLQFDTEGKTGGWQNKQGYIDQMVYLNRRMKEVVDAIVSRSPYPPVIIIQADHGSATRIIHGQTKYKQTAFVRERLPILNAYLVPESCRCLVTDDVSPVNSFRILFNGLFGEQFELLPNRHYFAWYGLPYNLKDVTEVVRPTSENRPRTETLAN